MVTLAEKYRGSREFGKNRRIAHSSWPVASYNEQHATITTTTFTTKARRHEDFSTNERGNYSDNLFVERIADADWSATPTGTTPLVNNLYQGMSYDAVTGLYYERARWYSPSLGTWISQDPLSYVNGANTYQFVMGNPVGTTDALGLDCCAAKYKAVQAALAAEKRADAAAGAAFAAWLAVGALQQALKSSQAVVAEDEAELNVASGSEFAAWVSYEYDHTSDSEKQYEIDKKIVDGLQKELNSAIAAVGAAKALMKANDEDALRKAMLKADDNAAKAELATESAMQAWMNCDESH